MRTSNIFKILIILNEIFIILAFGIKFTNLECHGFDPEFVQIPLCRLKVVARNKVSVNYHLKLLQLPLNNNLTVRGQLLRKSNEYRPFIYNTSTDFCRFLKNGHKFLFWKIILDIARPFTNVNHSCPLNHDIIVANLSLNESDMKLILFPAGDYLLRLYLDAYQKPKININAYFAIKDN
ncbi:uncharacterized protein LOC135958685 [Calliphora vicina]|uniref:uncharacterized protein LOC135958685 n=1 Tax=Calliphora vicina TaxID=7373 RepID=UPI00325BC643